MSDLLGKKLLFRAWHRGTREADLLMGRFAEAHIPHYNEEQLTLFSALLAESDPDIYDWITGRTALPDAPFTPLLHDFIRFYDLKT